MLRQMPFELSTRPVSIPVSIIRAALAAGSVAAEVRKIAKYAELGRRFIFQPVAVETSGAMGKSTIQFFKDLGRRLAVRFQDQRESDFLFQRVSFLFSGERLQHFAVVP